MCVHIATGSVPVLNSLLRVAHGIMDFGGGFGPESQVCGESSSG